MKCLENLIGNALKFTASSGRWFLLNIRNCNWRQESLYNVQVRDNGKGISKEDQERF